MKGYTDLEQSKKLAKILPIESADMYWKNGVSDKYIQCFTPFIIDSTGVDYDYDVPCWSLVALLSVLPFHLIVNNQRYAFNMIKGLDKNGETYAIKYAIFNTTFYLHLTNYYNNPIDACYEMILKLKEKNQI